MDEVEKIRSIRIRAMVSSYSPEQGKEFDVDAEVTFEVEDGRLGRILFYWPAGD